MSSYTVKNAMPTGKNSPQYGIEFYVQFNEMEDTAALWFKKQPEAGTTLDLENVNGKWKKVKKEWNPPSNTSENGPARGAGSSPSPARSYRDNSDGIRGGMCINNAANYVNSLEFPKALTDREWAQMVYGYAQALYALGELKVSEQYATSVAELMSDGS